jgi:peptidoglycan/LPS O-acetylase OafA/YrhL
MSHPPSASEIKNYMPSLDGIRGLACLLVLIAHISYIRADGTLGAAHGMNAVVGALGVEIFFVLSGFLMGALYMRQTFSFENAGKYVIARFSRIAPCYYLAITLAIFLAQIIPNFQYAMTPEMMARSYAFTSSQNVFWTITVEVQFYLFFLLLWAAYDRFYQGRSKLMVFSFLICIFMMATREATQITMLTNMLHIFLMGVIAGVAVQNALAKKITRNPVFQIGAVAAFIYYVAPIENPLVVYNDMLVAGLAAIMVMALSHSTFVSKIFETHTMRAIGAASFSIYLFHDLILHAFKDWGLLAQEDYLLNLFSYSMVAICIPMLFYYAVERFINRFTRLQANAVFDRVRMGPSRTQPHFISGAAR